MPNRPIATAALRLDRWRRKNLAAVSTPGAAVALMAYAGSMTPSLLPRPWYLQGVIAAFSSLAGYVLGVLIGAVFAALARWSDLTITMNQRARLVLSWLWVVIIAVVLLGIPVLTMAGQRLTAELVGTDPPSNWYVVGSALVAVAVFALALLLWRGLVAANDWLTRRGRKMLPSWLAKGLATTLVGFLVVVLLNQVILRGVMDFASRNAQATNQTAPQGYSAPTSPLRSGGPGSPETWESLGTEGAMFVSGGPTAAEIEAATGAPAIEPIRAYAGLSSGRTLPEVADAVVAELERTGAFERSAIAVFTTTGRGWVNEWNSSAFEFLGGGDTAIAAMQYSTLPSPLAVITEAGVPLDAGRVLFTAVADRIEELPEADRPKLYIGGESLGAYGGHAPFSSPQDMLGRVDGAVWCGTPGFTEIHQTLTAERQGGSTEVNPVIDNGTNIRFASAPSELTADQFGRPLGEWHYPRIVYLQHPSDPVVWWSPNLILSSPGWLDEPRDGQAGQGMTWFPVISFWQVTVDMAVATDVPSGYGHQYHEELVPTWAAVLGKDPDADYSAVIDAIND